MIEYRDSIDGIGAEQLVGFFEGWPDPPSPETHLKILAGSSEVVLALDNKTTTVVGFITANTDRILSASIPLLEVLPDYQKRGIGKRLVTQMVDLLGELYMIDLTCDPELQPFYTSLNMQPANGMSIRRYEGQCGRITSKPQ